MLIGTKCVVQLVSTWEESLRGCPRGESWNFSERDFTRELELVEGCPKFGVIAQQLVTIG